MRAQFIYEKFTEEGDPISDMGVGTIFSTMNVSELKRNSMEELQELYKRVHNKDKANVTVDGQEYNSLLRYEKIRFNNVIVKAIKYIRYIESRNQTRSAVVDKGFKRGDAVKADIRGKWYTGYLVFSKRGIIKTDSHGRIVARTLMGNKMKIYPDSAVSLTPKEQKEFDKQFYEKRKKQLEFQMLIYKNYPSSLQKINDEYDELMKTKKIRIE